VSKLPRCDAGRQRRWAITLEKRREGPVLATDADGWDRDRVADPDVRRIDGTYHMLYDGTGPDHWAIGHATSTDPLNWQKDPDNPVLKTGVGIAGTVVASLTRELSRRTGPVTCSTPASGGTTNRSDSPPHPTGRSGESTTRTRC